MNTSRHKQIVHSPETRRQIIIEKLNADGRIKVAELSDELGISVVTIRKDLDSLESEGLLERVHGGAVKNYKVQQFMNFQESMNTRKEAKMLIADAALRLINDDDSIIINVGSTSQYLAQRFHEKNNLIVITNALQVFNEIAYYKNITTFFLGGRFDTSMQFTYGDDTTDQLTKYKADKLFIGMDGIDLSAGATTYNHQEETVMRMMMEKAKEKILIVDDSKLGKITFAHIAPLTDFDAIITNYVKEREKYYESLRSLGLRVITAK